jgi:ATP-binding cassette subfamily B protein
MSILIFILGSGAAVIFLFRNFLIEIVAQSLERDARDEFVSNLMGKSLAFHDNQSIGDLMSRAATDVRLLNLMMNPGFVLVLQAALGIAIPVIFIYSIDPELTIIPVLFIIFFLVFLRRYNNTFAPIAYKQRMFSGVISGRLNEVITGIYVVRGMNQESKERAIFYKNIGDFKQTTIDQGKIMARYWPLLFLGITTVLALFHSLFLLEQGRLNIGQIVAYMGLIQLLRFPTFINIFALTVITMGVTGARRILQLINWESKIDLNPSGYSQPIKGVIKFENVSFGYTEHRLNVKNISFSVEPGQTVALVGMTGSGKTTITKLLARLYDPQSGVISIDGVPLTEWSIQSLRSQMAVVEQDIFLFSKTIRENIAFGLDVSFDQIKESAKIAQAHNFISKLPKGYETNIGERGVTLSGGQRQRIAIARAILRNPRILILDDASSAIDSRTEDEIQQAIKSVLKGRVSFLITHRLAQIRRADQIILLDQGEIIGRGNHLELLKTNEKYRAIFSSFDEYDKIYGNI